MKLSPGMVQGFVRGKSDAELRELVRTVFQTISGPQLDIAASELLAERESRAQRSAGAGVGSAR